MCSLFFLFIFFLMILVCFVGFLAHWLPLLSLQKTADSFIPVQFSHSVVSDSLGSHGLQYAKLPCPSPTHVHCVSDAIQPSCVILFSSPSIFPSIRAFSRELVLCIRWPRYWSFSFSISASAEYSGLSSFKVDWLDLLEVQGTLKSLLQHHSSKA